MSLTLIVCVQINRTATGVFGVGVGGGGISKVSAEALSGAF